MPACVYRCVHVWPSTFWVTPWFFIILVSFNTLKHFFSPKYQEIYILTRFYCPQQMDWSDLLRPRSWKPQTVRFLSLKCIVFIHRIRSLVYTCTEIILKWHSLRFLYHFYNISFKSSGAYIVEILNKAISSLGKCLNCNYDLPAYIILFFINNSITVARDTSYLLLCPWTILIDFHLHFQGQNNDQLS